MERKEYAMTGDVLYSGTAACGLRVRVLPKKGFSGTYAVFATDYGGTYRRFILNGQEADTPAGVAHYLEHKMFDLPNGENALTTLSSRGADVNAFTSTDITAYHFQCTESFEENLRTLLQFVSTPFFTEETVEKERGIIEQEIHMGEDNPGTANYYSLLSLLYQKHPIREKVIGTVESISRITADTLYQCHRAFYRPSNMVLAVAGDVNPDDVLRIVDEEILPADPDRPQVLMEADEGLVPAETRHTLQMPVSQPLFLIGAKILPEKDGPALCRQDLVASLAAVLLAGQSSLLYHRLYEKGLLNRRFDCGADRSRGVAYAIFGGESRDPEAVFQALCEEIRRVAEHGFDPALFDRMKRAAIGGNLRAMEDFEDVCVSLAAAEFDGYCYLDVPAVSMDLTREECEDFVRAWLVPEHLVMSVVQPLGASQA